MTDDVYLLSYIFSLRTAFCSTLICLLLGYPMAYGIARAPRSTQTILLLLIILPFWTSFLLRVYALQGIISEHGLLNNLLLWLGLIHTPLRIMHTTLAVYIGIVYSYLPFMILPLYATLEKLGRHAAGGGRRSRHAALARLPGNHIAALAARRDRRLNAGVHTGDRRVRYSIPAGRTGQPDDRPRVVG